MYNLLKERGVEAWYDAKIAAGEDWRTTTANALNDAPIFVLLMSKLASESGDIAKELAAATHKRKLVVPVRLDDMQLEGMFLYELASRNWIDAYHNTEQKLAELADKLAALVKAGLSPEAAAALEVSAAEIAAAQGETGKKASKRDGSGSSAFGEKRKAGSVAIISAAAVALVAAAGGGVWFFTKGPGPSAVAQADVPAAAASVAAVASAPGGAAPAAATGAEPAAAKASLAASLTELAATAKTQGRKDEDVAALTDAGAKLGALDLKMLTGAAPLPADANDVALAAARGHIAAIAADPLVASVRSDIRSVAAEQKASGVKLDAVLSGAVADADGAIAAIKAATEAAAGADGAAAVAAAASAQAAFDTLSERQPATSNAFLMSKRQGYAANSAAGRSAAAKITQVFTSVKKPGVFDSKEKKEAYKYLLATDTWARGRMAEVDVAASAVTTADRKTLAKHAALAATARTELETALTHVREQAARLGG
jgi:hypothetical protein